MGFLSGIGNFLGGIAKVAAPVAGAIFAPVTGGASLAAGIGISKAISGLQQGAQAKELEKQNVRPVDTPEDEYFQNVAEAENQARVGMNQQQYNNAENDIQRNQAYGARMASRVNGGGLAAIAGLVDSSNRATNQLNAQDDAIRQQNEAKAMQARQQLAMRKTQAFNWNFKQKFLENAAAIRALKGASQQNIWGGLTSAAGALSGATTGGSSGGGLLSGIGGLLGIGKQNQINNAYINSPASGLGAYSTDFSQSAPISYTAPSGPIENGIYSTQF